MPVLDMLLKCVDRDEEIVEKDEIEEDSNWKSTRLCIHFLKDSYREKEGTGHAICSNGKCKIHYDNANPHNDLLKHIVFDSPYRMLKTIAIPLLVVYNTKVYASSIASTIKSLYKD